MNYYAGLDVSLEETAICVVDGSGLIVKEVRAASEPEALIAALKSIDVPLERIGLEACSLTAWLHDGLWGAGLPADLHRDAAGERCDEDDAEQDRSQRRAGACSDHADGLV